jgi:hypothetical protein
MSGLERLYPGMGHIINDDEIREITRLIDGISPRG